MKIVELRRHTIRDDDGNVTDIGKELATKAKSTLLSDYKLYITSTEKQTKETMEALGFNNYKENTNFKMFDDSKIKSHNEKLSSLAREKGLTKFGAMFEVPEIMEIFKEVGSRVSDGIKSLTAELSSGDNALVVLQGGPIELGACEMMGKYNLDEVGGEIGYCDGIRFYFEDDNSFVKIENVKS